ncbi:replication-associated recombination protein A [Mycoplasma sp. NEAQ87857]|uniref:replication-associated recombination protein A n=1 Tax=Mycoplasma sp. NEAQ87857 TaxID=2683967 RepID=UPI00351A26EC
MNKNLANQLRPNKIDDIVGQTHVKKLLKQVVKNNLTTSFLFFGESGIGKTTAAMCLANEMNLNWGYFNASVDAKNKLIEILDNCDVVIIDEIHRLNKDKQDILLSYLEFDKIIVYATTTENPYFKVVPALRSRMQILELYKLSINDIVDGLRKIIDQNFNNLNISDKMLIELANYSAGDYRSSINNLQMLALLKSNNEPVSLADLKDIIPNINFYSDANSTAHYDNLSAFHKSLRGSDYNAALYYGLLILKSGDYDGLFRRMLCVAYEDIGLASIGIGSRVENAIKAYERLGMPEGKLPITYAIMDLALAPKSNSVYQAINQVEQVLNQGQIYQVPKHLKDAHYNSAKKLGYGLEYLYPHDYPNNYIKQDYLPKELLNYQFFEFGDNLVEKKLKQYWTNIKKGDKDEV